MSEINRTRDPNAVVYDDKLSPLGARPKLPGPLPGPGGKGLPGTSKPLGANKTANTQGGSKTANKSGVNAKQQRNDEKVAPASAQGPGAKKARSRPPISKRRQAEAKKARANKAEAKKFEATQSTTTFEAEDPRIKTARGLPPEESAYVHQLRAVASDLDQGPVLPMPESMQGTHQQSTAKTREVVRGFLNKSADYVEFAKSMQVANLATEAASNAGQAASPSALPRSAAAAPIGAAVASPVAAVGGPQAAVDATPHQDLLSSIPAKRPDGRHVLSDLSKMSYASLGDGPNVFKLIMLMMNEKRMERTYMLMMQKHAIEATLTRAQISELLTQVHLVAGGIYIDRVMAMADFTQSLSLLPNNAGKNVNKDLTNVNPNIPEMGENAWSPERQHQGRAPAAETRAANWIKTVSSHPNANIKYGGPNDEKDMHHEKDRQYFFDRSQTEIIAEYNKNHPLEDRILTETFPGSNKHVRSLYLSADEVRILGKMDDFARQHRVDLNLRATYEGDPDKHIQGVRNDLLSNRRDDFPGHLASRDEDFRAHQQAAREAEAEAQRLDALGKTQEAAKARIYARAHAQGGSREDPEKGRFDRALRTSLTYNYDSMEIKPDKLENLQLGSLHSANRTYYSFIDELKQTDPNVLIAVNDERLSVKQATLDDLRRRAVMNTRATAQKMHLNTHAYSAAGDDYRSAVQGLAKHHQLATANKNTIDAIEAEIKVLKGKETAGAITPLERATLREREVDLSVASAERTELTASEEVLKEKLDIAKRDFALPAYPTHREARFRTGEAQVLHQAMKRDLEALEKLPVSTPEQKQVYAERLLLNKVMEREFKLNSPPRQVQAADLFHRTLKNDNKLPQKMAEFDLVGPKDMERHCQEALKNATQTVKQLESVPESHRRSFEKERLSAAKDVQKSATTQLALWKGQREWVNRANKPMFWSALPKRNERAARTGSLDLRPAPRMEMGSARTADDQGTLTTRVPYVATESQQGRVEYSETQGASEASIKKAINEQAESDLDHGRVDLLSGDKHSDYLDAMETGGRMALQGYHDSAVEGSWNEQIIANFMQQLQGPFNSIQDATTGDAQNAAAGAAGLADDASNSVTSAFASNYDQVHAMITRLNSIMNSFSGF